LYRVEITDGAERDLEQIRPEKLSGPLADLFKLRVGDYRVFYDILQQEQIIVVHRVRHRREAYR
jgi:mRNA interferase RelE/StbE